MSKNTLGCVHVEHFVDALSSALSLSLPLCLSLSPQNQPQEETCCFTLVCPLILKGDGLSSTPPPLSKCLHVAEISQGLKPYWCECSASSQRLLTVSESVCPATSLHLTLLQCVNCNNPAGLTSLPCVIHCVGQKHNFSGEKQGQMILVKKMLPQILEVEIGLQLSNIPFALQLLHTTAW